MVRWRSLRVRRGCGVGGQGTLTSRGSIEPQRWVVIFWGTVMGAIAIIMLLVAPGSEALTGIQNITIIMAAPFALIMMLLCVALTRDLRNDPLVRRDTRTTEAIQQAVVYGTQTYGDRFFLNVKPHEEDEQEKKPAPEQRRSPAED